jgi:hypothetical protein
MVSLHPSVGSVFGGLRVTIHGSGFSRSSIILCSFGHYNHSFALKVEDTFVICRSPPSSGTKTVQVRISSDEGNSWSSSWAEFEFTPAAVVRQIEPSSVVSGQMTSVTVMGSGFSGGSGVVCGLGDLDALSGRWLSAERIVCNVLADRVGNATLRVSSNAGVDWSDGVVMSVLGVGSVARVLPSIGSVSGGSSVRVKGSGFISGPATCLFGNASAPGRVGVDGDAECLSPAHPAGRVGVQVEHSGGVAHGAVQFEYVNDFVVRGVVPSSGVAGASVVVTVVGSGFLETGMWLRIGADAAAFACNCSSGGSTLVCFTLLGSQAGFATLFLSHDSLSNFELSAMFFIFEVFEVSIVSESICPGHDLLVRLDHNQLPFSCIFNGVFKVDATLLSSSILGCHYAPQGDISITLYDAFPKHIVFELRLFESSYFSSKILFTVCPQPIVPDFCFRNLSFFVPAADSERFYLSCSQGCSQFHCLGGTCEAIVSNDALFELFVIQNGSNQVILLNF